MIKTLHCTNCGEELTYTNGYAEEIFYYCKNKKCVLKGVQQLGKEYLEELNKDS